MKRFAVAAICAVFVLVGAPPRARAQSFFGGLPIDTIHCETIEGAVEHIHSHLQLFDRGQPVSIPAGVGIPPGGSCLYWVHTHTNDGIVHIESPNTHPFTLGQFFDIWGMSLDVGHAAGVKAPRGRTLSVWVNGRPYRGNPRSIVLRDREEIVIQNGPPFAKPSKYDWSKL
ncbi:MAG TPA: hypothetical protein VMS32_05575 [Verrucomicrobiae bacterium]|jgi:hypothetical protein|nr:hypothetical protein [Verrucomicrobiae bacterium]